MRAHPWPRAAAAGGGRAAPSAAPRGQTLGRGRGLCAHPARARIPARPGRPTLPLGAAAQPAKHPGTEAGLCCCSLFFFFPLSPLSPLKFSVSSLTWLTFRQRGGQRHGSAHGSRGQRGPGAPAGAAWLEPGPGPATPAPASPPAARLRRLRPILREPRLLFEARQSLKAGGVTETPKR